jgi:hypothetical protein
LKSVGGDFEIMADPQDSAKNLIFIANVGNGASSVVAARLSATTGQATAGTLTTVANNFSGDSSINGPEFVQKPSGALGVMYAGPGGVHAVFRGDIPASWNNLAYNADGSPTGGSPVALAATSEGAYPAYQVPGQYTYSFFHGACTSHCAADVRQGTYTDAELALNSMGLSGAGASLSPRDGYAVFGACTGDNQCGIYEGEIDGAGGFVPGTFQRIATTEEGPADVTAARHPVTGTTVIFTSNDGQKTVDVWEQPAAGGQLTLLAQVPSVRGKHFRAYPDDPSKVVLHYYGGSVLKRASYTIAVKAQGTTLVAGPANNISPQDAGSELAYLPAANKWALYYRASGQLQRCWVTP